MAKRSQSSGSKVKLKCAFCQQEFEATRKKNMDDIECPYCGRSAAYVLNADGIPVSIVGEGVKDFIHVNNGGGNIMPQIYKQETEEDELNMIISATKRANAELLNQLVMDTFLERQKAALYEARLKAEQYKKELERLRGESGIPEEQNNQMANVQKVQAFLQALSTMDEKTREELLKQLEENPHLAITIGWMLNPPNPQQLGFFNPFMFYLPQMVQSGGETQNSSVDIASLITSIVNAIKTMYEIAQPKQADISDAIKPIIDEIKSIKQDISDLRDKYYNLQIAKVEAPSHELNNILNRIEALERKVEESRTPKYLVEEIKALRELYEETQNLFGANKKEESIDEWIKKREFEFKLEKQKKEEERRLLELQEKLEKKKFAKALLLAAMQRAMNVAKDEAENREQKEKEEKEKEEGKEERRRTKKEEKVESEVKTVI